MRAARVFAFTSLLLAASAAPPLAPTAHAQRYLRAGILRLDPTGQCMLLVNPESLYQGPVLLDNYWWFPVGDTVMVAYEDSDERACGSSRIYPCLRGVRMWPRRDFDFGCGTLWVDPEYHCRRFQSDSGRWLLLERYYEGSNRKRVRVKGDLSFTCGWIMDCEADYCLDDAVALACDEPPPAVLTTSWGRIKRVFR